MTAKYFAILTNYGAAQLANAVALGTQMNISAMAVGDGGGTLPVPDPAQTKLVRENRRAAVNQVSIDEKNPNFIIAEQVIPENEGGWWIREIGLFDDTGGLIAVGNAPEAYKPNLQEGSGRTQVIQIVLMVSSTQAITLKVDPSVVLATREYVTKSIDVAIQASEARAAQIYATKKELNSGLSGKQPTGDYATKEDLKTKLTKSENGADIQNKDAFIKNLGLGGAAKSNVVQTTGTSVKDVMSQKAITDALKNAVNIDTIYPVGVVIWFAQNKNPNSLFPGTKWSYIGENKTIRLANSSGNNVLSSGGSDSITLTTAHLPAHSHSFSGSTSSFDYGTKTTNTTGAHTHTYNDNYVAGSAGPNGAGDRKGPRQTESAGNHNHTVAIGAHSHSFSGTTGNSGSGSSVSVVNAYIMLMGWYRTA